MAGDGPGPTRRRPASGNGAAGRAAAGRGLSGDRPPSDSLEGCPVAAESWRRLAKATVARRFIALLVLLVLPMGSRSVLDGAFVSAGPDEPAWRATARRGLGVVAVGGTMLLIVGTLQGDLRRRRLVADHDGCVDPDTLAPLMTRGRDVAFARGYWWTWLVTGESPSVFALRTGRPSEAGEPPPSRGIWPAMIAASRELVAPALLLLAIPLINAFLAGRSPLTAMLVPGPAFLALVVVSWVPWLTVPGEVPLRRCHQCDQSLAREASRCPECGVPIDPELLRAARPRSARRAAEALIATIAVCWIIGVVAGRPIARAVRTSPAVPIASLLSDLSAAPAWDAATFETIVGRPTDDVTASRLSEILLQRRRAGARVGAEAWRWFDSAVAAGTVPVDHETTRWRDSIELLRLIPVHLDAEDVQAWGGIAMHTSAGAAVDDDVVRRVENAERLAVRFVRRFDASDGRRVGVVVVGVRVGGRELLVPRRDDGSLCLVSAGSRPTQAAWLPEDERHERPWPAPAEYVLPLPPFPPDVSDAIAAGAPVTLDVLRFVAAPGRDAVSVAWADIEPQLIGPVVWHERASIDLDVLTADVARDLRASVDE